MRDALDLRRAALGPSHPDVAASLAGVAFTLARKGHPREAAVCYGDALAVRTSSLGPRHPEVARDHQNLASVLSDLRDFKEAREHLTRALAVYGMRTGHGTRASPSRSTISDG